MRWLGGLAAVATVAIITASSRSARADAAVCAETAERGQRARRAGKLIDAREAFLACSHDCPKVVATDCAAWASDVLAATPTIVIDSKDESGHDIANAALSVDGVLTPHALDGRAIAVDPGAHQLTLERGSQHVTESIIAKEGVQARTIRMVLPAGDVPQTPARESAGHTVYPWILVGAGVAVAVAGVVLIATAPSLPSDCEKATGKCTEPPGEPRQDFLDDQSRAGESEGRPTIGIAVILTGAAMVAGGLVWHFLETPKSRSAMITPWLGLGRAGVSGAF